MPACVDKSKNIWGPYLKHFLIQDSGSKDSDSIGVDNSTLTPAQGLGHFLLAVNDDGHSLLLHADGNAMPPGRGRGDKRQRGDQKMTGGVVGKGLNG